MSVPSLITMFTDAGYCPERKIGTWAVWAKRDGKTFRYSGVLRGEVDDSAIAELRATVNGVCAVLAAMKPEKATKIIAQSDCESAVGALLGSHYKRKEARKRVESATNLLHKRLRETGVVVEYRHVSGHRGTVNPRAAVNTWCDQECTRLLRQARKSAGQKTEAEAA